MIKDSEKTRAENHSSSFLANPKIRHYIKLTKLKLSDEHEDELNIFMRVLELSLTQGRWNGFFPMES